MKPTEAIVLPAAIFTGTLALAWGVRIACSPPAVTTLRNTIPAGVRTFEVRGPGGQEGTPDIKLSELRSVRNGLVLLPLDASPDAVAAAFARAWEKLSANPGADMRLQARQLFSDWMKVDPEAAIRFVSEPPGVLIRRGGEYLLTALAETDPERACQIALKSGLDSKAASGAVLNVWGSRDPAAALAFAASLPAHQRLAAELSTLNGWAAASGPDAFAWLEAQPKGWRRDQLMNRMSVCMLQNSPEDIVRRMQQGDLPEEMLNGLRQWEAQTKPQQILSSVHAAIAAGGKLEDLLRVFGTDSLSSGMLPPHLREIVRQQSSERFGPLATALVISAVQIADPKSPDDIARLVKAFTGTDAGLFLRALGEAAPEAGLIWALENDQTLTGLAASWAKYDAKSAMQRLLALPRGGKVDEAVRQFMATAAQSAPVETMEAALQVPMAPRERAKHLCAAARVLARSDPAQAILGLGRIPDAPPEEVSAVLAISGRSDAKAAAAALAQVDLHTNGYIAAESLTRGWVMADPSGASEWVRTLPAGELRNGGAAGLARSVMESDPSAAFTWAVEINDANLRESIALQAMSGIKKTQTLEQVEADPQLSETARGLLRDYWNRRSNTITVGSPETLPAQVQ